MSSLPKISFVLPVRNRAKLLFEALQSLRAQTISEWEAIVVDDHGTDKLEKKLEGFDSRVRYVSLPDKCGNGVACARNYGNLVARAKLIAVLDSDDLAKPDRVERVLKSYAIHKWDFYCSARETIGEVKGALTIQKKTPKTWSGELFKTQSYVTHSSVVYTRTSALEIPYNSVLFSLEDYDLITRFITAGKRMFYDPAVTVIYRRHEGETLTTHVSMRLRKKMLHAIRTWRGWEKEDLYPEF